MFRQHGAEHWADRTGRALGSPPDVGFSVGQCLALAGVLVAGPAMFAAIGALSSQLAGTRRRAVALASILLGVSYALRMVADSSPGLRSVAWLIPLGRLEWCGR